MPLDPRIVMSIRAPDITALGSGFQQGAAIANQKNQNERQNRLLDLQEQQYQNELALLEEKRAKEKQLEDQRYMGSTFNTVLEAYDPENVAPAISYLESELQKVTDPTRQQALTETINGIKQDPVIAGQEMAQLRDMARHRKLIPEAEAGKRVTAIDNGKEVPAILNAQGQLISPSTNKRMPNATLKERTSSRGDYNTTFEAVSPIDNKIHRYSFNTRTKETVDLGLVSTNDPSVIKDQSAAKKLGTEEGGRAFTMSGLVRDIESAEDLLRGETGEKVEPTGSGVGQLTDAAGRIVGISSKSSKQAARLEVAGGRLVQRVPRFEGPQSDADRLTYQEMAGKVANRGIPAEERLAAIDTMKEILSRYDEDFKSKEGIKGIGIDTNKATRTPSVVGKPTPPPEAIELLRNNNSPEMRNFFIQKYGELPKDFK